MVLRSTLIALGMHAVMNLCMASDNIQCPPVLTCTIFMKPCNELSDVLDVAAMMPGVLHRYCGIGFVDAPILSQLA